MFRRIADWLNPSVGVVFPRLDAIGANGATLRDVETWLSRNPRAQAIVMKRVPPGRMRARVEAIIDRYGVPLIIQPRKGAK